MNKTENNCRIVVRPRGGLCNRMHAIAATYTLARKIGRKAKVVWVVDWSLGTRYENMFQPIENIVFDTYRWKGAEQRGTMLERAYAAYYSTTVFDTTRLHDYSPKIFSLTDLPHYSAVRWRLLRWVKQQLRSFEFDLVIESEQTKKGLTNEEVEAVQQSGKTLIITNYEFIKPETTYSSLFKLKPQLRKLVDDATQNVTDRTIGVHIRRGDHERAIRQSPEDAFRRAMKEEIEKDPNATFFLATDSEETKQSLQKEFDNRRILSNDVPLTRKSTSGLQGAIIDLYSLARTRKILGSRVSTFSGMAAKIGGIPLLRVSSKEMASMQP